MDTLITQFPLELRAPYASRYRITVEAIGTQDRSFGRTLKGTQFYGEGVVNATLGGTEPLTLDMANVVPQPFIRYSPREEMYLTWQPVPHAIGYTALGTLYGQPDTLVHLIGTEFYKGDLAAWRFRVRAELYNGFSAAYSEPEINNFVVSLHSR